jgi:hypothetical protein
MPVTATKLKIPIIHTGKPIKQKALTGVINKNLSNYSKIF